MTLEQVTTFIENKEKAKKSSTHLLGESTTGAIRSSYRLGHHLNTGNPNPKVGYGNQNTKFKTPQSQQQCRFCGQMGHNSTDLAVRKRLCPASGKRCPNCGKIGHFGTVCRSRPPQQVPSASAITNEFGDEQPTEDIEGAIFQLCTLNVNQWRPTPGVAIGHHLYDNLQETWVKQRSKPQPTFTLDAEISSKDFEALGSTRTSHKRITRRHPVIAIADTGCQSCLAGVDILHKLGHTLSDIIPVTTKMSSASGATFIRLSGSDSHGRTHSTR